MKRYSNILSGGDLRSIGKANEVASMVKTAKDFDKLFNGLYHPDRKVVMRTADAIEKISIDHPEFLQKHKTSLLGLCRQTAPIELKWHLAQLLARLTLSAKEQQEVWNLLTAWAADTKESRIVRVNAIQALYSLTPQKPSWWKDFSQLLAEIRKENIASLNARIRKLLKAGEG